MTTRSKLRTCDGCGMKMPQKMRQFFIEEVANRKASPAIICVVCVAKVLSAPVRLERFGYST